MERPTGPLLPLIIITMGEPSAPAEPSRVEREKSFLFSSPYLRNRWSEISLLSPPSPSLQAVTKERGGERRRREERAFSSSFPFSSHPLFSGQLPPERGKKALPRYFLPPQKRENICSHNPAGHCRPLYVEQHQHCSSSSPLFAPQFRHPCLHVPS